MLILQAPVEAFRKARHNLWKSLVLHGKAQEAREVSKKKLPSGRKLPPPPPPVEAKGATAATPTHRGGDASNWAATMEKEDEKQ